MGGGTGVAAQMLVAGSQAVTSHAAEKPKDPSRHATKSGSRSCRCSVAAICRTASDPLWPSIAMRPPVPPTRPESYGRSQNETYGPAYGLPLAARAATRAGLLSVALSASERHYSGTAPQKGSLSGAGKRRAGRFSLLHHGARAQRTPLHAPRAPRVRLPSLLLVCLHLTSTPTSRAQECIRPARTARRERQPPHNPASARNTPAAAPPAARGAPRPAPPPRPPGPPPPHPPQ